MAVNGNTIIIHTGDAVVGSQRGVTIDSATEMLDVSDKTDTDAKFIPGKRTDTVTLSAFYVRDDTAQAALRTAYNTNAAVEVDWFHTSTDGLSGSGEFTCLTGYISSLSVSAPDHGPAETEITLQISGGWGTYAA
tara:strand:+ start:444 stop:848 length:405 start_codon:yes stop_codon:yes gene_type:complete